MRPYSRCIRQLLLVVKDAIFLPRDDVVPLPQAPVLKASSAAAKSLDGGGGDGELDSGAKVESKHEKKADEYDERHDQERSASGRMTAGQVRYWKVELVRRGRQRHSLAKAMANELRRKGKDMAVDEGRCRIITLMCSPAAISVSEERLGRVRGRGGGANRGEKLPVEFDASGRPVAQATLGKARETIPSPAPPAAPPRDGDFGRRRTVTSVVVEPEPRLGNDVVERRHLDETHVILSISMEARDLLVPAWRATVTSIVVQRRHPYATRHPSRCVGRAARLARAEGRQPARRARHPTAVARRRRRRVRQRRRRGGRRGGNGAQRRGDAARAHGALGPGEQYGVSCQDLVSSERVVTVWYATGRLAALLGPDGGGRAAAARAGGGGERRRQLEAQPRRRAAGAGRRRRRAGAGRRRQGRCRRRPGAGL